MFFFPNSSILFFTFLRLTLFKLNVIVFRFCDIWLLDIIKQHLSVNKFWLKFKLHTLLSARDSNSSPRQSSVSLFFTSFNVFNFFDFLIKGQRLKILASPTSAPVKSIVYALSFFKSSTAPLNFYGMSVFFFFFGSYFAIWTAILHRLSFTNSRSSRSFCINLDC